MRSCIAVFTLTMLGLASLTVLTASAQSGDPGPSRPDFSGLWFPAGFARITPQPLPYTEAAQALAERYDREFSIDDDPGRFCIWPGMPRAIWGAPFAIEVIQRPQDLTIFWEGYGMYRKIYMADRDPPEPLLNSAMGHSIAYWEADALVVETTHLRPYPYMSRMATTSHATLVERISLERRTAGGEVREYLVNEVTLTDPGLYRTSIEIRAEAERRSDLELLEYTCTDTLWNDYLQQRGLVLPDVDALPISSGIER